MYTENIVSSYFSVLAVCDIIVVGLYPIDVLASPGLIYTIKDPLTKVQEFLGKKNTLHIPVILAVWGRRQYISQIKGLKGHEHNLFVRSTI